MTCTFENFQQANDKVNYVANYWDKTSKIIALYYTDGHYTNNEYNETQLLSSVFTFTHNIL